MFTNHRKSVDYILLAMASLDEGDMEGAAEYLKEAQEEPDLDVALEEMNEANEEAFGEDFEEDSKRKSCSTASARRARLRRERTLAEALEDGEEELVEEEPMEEEEEEPVEEEASRVTARLARARRNLRTMRSV